VGSRIYFPLEHRGENLAASLGASYYRASPHHGVAFELAVYALSSVVGLSITVAPWLTAREVSTALTIRYY
jgi:4-hydroxy-L-threonine phosphate dehydrogenase PdxA